MSDRRRYVAFAILALACLGAAATYVIAVALRGSGGGVPVAASPAEIRLVTSRPFVVFLTSSSGKAPYDELAISSLAHPDRPALVGLRCDRVAMTESTGVCVRHSTSVGLTYQVRFFDRRFRTVSSAGGVGLPSRARVSPSGRVASVTSFIAGDSYASSGEFSTAAAIFRTGSGKVLVGNLEQIHVMRHGQRFQPLNRNFWGVTFVDDRRFYATMGVGSHTYLVRGDIARRTAEVVHGNVECPALSPDGRRIAFKRRKPDGDWRLTILDLRTGSETPLAERRSVDDQLAWLDDSHVVYGDAGSVWIVRADGAGDPRLLIEHAASPTVVHAASPA